MNCKKTHQKPKCRINSTAAILLCIPRLDRHASRLPDRSSLWCTGDGSTGCPGLGLQSAGIFSHSNRRPHRLPKLSRNPPNPPSHSVKSRTRSQNKLRQNREKPQQPTAHTAVGDAVALFTHCGGPLKICQDARRTLRPVARPWTEPLRVPYP